MLNASETSPLKAEWHICIHSPCISYNPQSKRKREREREIEREKKRKKETERDRKKKRKKKERRKERKKEKKEKKRKKERKKKQQEKTARNWIAQQIESVSMKISADPLHPWAPKTETKVITPTIFDLIYVAIF